MLIYKNLLYICFVHYKYFYKEYIIVLIVLIDAIFISNFYLYLDSDRYLVINDPSNIIIALIIIINFQEPYVCFL